MRDSPILISFSIFAVRAECFSTGFYFRIFILILWGNLAVSPKLFTKVTHRFSLRLFRSCCECTAWRVDGIFLLIFWDRAMAMTKGVDGWMRWWNNGRSMRLCLGSWICDVVVCGSLRFVGFTYVSRGRSSVWSVASPINCTLVFSSKLPVFTPISIFFWPQYRPFPARQGTYTSPYKFFHPAVFSKVVISLWRVQAQLLFFPDLRV